MALSAFLFHKPIVKITMYEVNRCGKKQERIERNWVE